MERLDALTTMSPGQKSQVPTQSGEPFARLGAWSVSCWAQDQAHQDHSRSIDIDISLNHFAPIHTGRLDTQEFFLRSVIFGILFSLAMLFDLL